MGRVLIIGAGGVGTVVAHKVAQNADVFTDIMIASRTKEKCDKIVEAIGNPNIKTAKVDADNVEELVALFNDFKPEMVINVALPYQDLTIMEACLKAGVNYLDTANYEPKDEAHFEYSWQWAYHDRFKEAGLTAILGCGFDPGVSGIYTAYAAKHYFDEIQYLDIVDCNAGNHHKAFATNFNPEINIREITQNGRYYENGKWVTTGPLEIHKDLTYPNIGPRDSYLLYHEELESLVKHYQDLTIMEACLKAGVNYLDTANYEPKDEAHFEYSWQWAYHDRFKEAGLTAILGCGFDPGVSGIYTAYAAKHYFDEIQYLDIVDCNAGNHHKAFATNFNPEINIREITQNGRYYENGKWVTTGPLEIHKDLTYPNIGPRDSYLLYHEELESLVKHYPTIKRARFWMTFGQEYLTHLRVIQNIGMARIDEVDYNGMKIVPLQFLKAVLPNPQDLGENYEGETSIGCRIRGLKDGKERTYYVYNNCSHQEAYQETGMQGVSYTTGVPAMIGAMMFFKGEWNRPGVNNVEEFNPDPFMEQLNKQGLPWHEEFDKDLEL